MYLGLNLNRTKLIPSGGKNTHHIGFILNNVFLLSYYEIY